jgi:hypothetical protein
VEISVGAFLAFLGLAPLSFVELTFRLRHFCLAAADGRRLSNKYANCHPHLKLVGLGPLFFYMENKLLLLGSLLLAAISFPVNVRLWWFSEEKRFGFVVSFASIINSIKEKDQ